MKPLRRKLASSLAVFVLLSVSQLASAFYDPTLSRWLNRDPSFDLGFRDLPHITSRSSYGQGLYSFLDNRVVNSIDSYGLYSFGTSCTTAQRDKIKNAIKSNCDKAKRCACAGDAIASSVSGLCDNPDGTNPVINCPDANSPLPGGGTCDACGKGDIGGNQIYLCPDSFNPRKQDPFGCPLGCVIFHEANHNQALEHGGEMNAFDSCMGCPRQ